MNRKNRSFGYLILIIFSIILCIPSNNDIYFDGLTFNKITEVFILLFFIPIVFLFKINFNYIQKIILIVLVLIKIILIFNIKSGIIVEQFLIINSDDKIKKIKVLNYDGLWNNEKSIIASDLKQTGNFPIEWINYYNPTTGDIEPFCHFKEVECNKLFSKVENYNIEFNLFSIVHLKKDSKFFINADGSINSEIFLTDELGQSLEVFILKNKTILDLKKLPYVKKGKYILEGKIVFNSNKLSFEPIINLDNKNYSAFDKNVFYQSKPSINFLYNFIDTLCMIFNALTIILILSFSVIFFRKVIKYLSFSNFKFFYFNMMFFLLLFFLFKVFFINSEIFNLISSSKSLNHIFSGTFIIALYLCSILLIVFFQRKKFISNDFDTLKYFYYFFIFTLILFFVCFFWIDKVPLFSIHSQGDDWWIFEYYAYRILFLKEYLRAGEDVLLFRPLIRYLSALFHILFGQTFVIHRIIDTWAILFTGLFTFYILKLNKQNLIISFIFSIILLIFYFGETFKLLIGKGLSEYYASIILIFVSYKIIKHKNNLNLKKIFIFGSIAVLGVWFREDHLFVTLAIIIFSIGSYKYQQNLIGLIYTVFLQHKKNIFSFGMIISFGFFMLFFRNYIVSGTFFGSNVHYNVGTLNFDSWIDIYTILSGSMFPDLPRTFSLFNFIAFVLSLYLIFLRKVKIELLSFSIIIISIVLPYLFLKNWGYYPRYSIHLLPFSFILILLFFEKRIENIYKKLIK